MMLRVSARSVVQLLFVGYLTRVVGCHRRVMLSLPAFLNIVARRRITCKIQAYIVANIKRSVINHGLVPVPIIS
jgi:hypothetical protein